eukprot:Platyproteum_vivax@DN7658_c0_g1_i6.p1
MHLQVLSTLLKPEQLQPVMEGAMDASLSFSLSFLAALSFFILSTPPNHSTSSLTYPTIFKAFSEVSLHLAPAALLAGVVGTSFTPYYAHVIPLMKRLVQASTSEDDKRLRGKGWNVLACWVLPLAKMLKNAWKLC